jgi:hypothetical protein
MSEKFKTEFTFENGKTEDKAFGDKTFKHVDVKVNDDAYVKALEANEFDIKIVKKLEQFNEQYVKDVVKTSTENSVKLYKDGAEATTTVAPFGISTRNNITVDGFKNVTKNVAGKEYTGPSVKVAVKTVYTKVSSSYIKSMKDLVDESLANG